MDLRICHAIAERRLLSFTYRGSERVVEPHLYGATMKRHEVLCAWVRRGGTASGSQPAWRTFSVNQITGLSILPERFDGPRPDFNPQDPTFEEVFRCVEPARDGASGAPVR